MINDLAVVKLRNYEALLTDIRGLTLAYSKSVG